MQPDQATNNGGRTMELIAAAPRCQLLLIVLMAAMLLPGMKVAPLLIWRKIARTIELQENIGKGQFGKVCQGKWTEDNLEESVLTFYQLDRKIIARLRFLLDDGRVKEWEESRGTEKMKGGPRGFPLKDNKLP
ncbi:hypothetical protein STEG23_004829, partial [Scotinomys teguina]